MLLFTYGQLMHPHQPYNLALRGEMRMRTADDPAVHFHPAAPRLVYGQVHEMTPEQIRRTDRWEHPQYALRKVAHLRGRAVYAFEYVGGKWGRLPVVVGGKFRRNQKPRVSAR